MMCYKDKTWCPYGKACVDSKECDKNFTKEEKIKAVKWWGNEHFPITFYSKLPKCFNDGKACNNSNKE
jgi:hypothetical protein